MPEVLPSHDPATTAALVERIRSGDPQAEAELVDTYSQGLRLMLRRLVRDPALAEDLHQETFRVVLEKARSGEIENPEKLAGFLRGTARNLHLAEGRRSGRLRPAGDAAALEEHLPADVAPQLRRLLRQEEAGLVRRLLGEMRFERDRRVLVQFYLSERSKEEVCDDLGVDAAGFKKVLFHARQRLRDLWERSEKRQHFMRNTGGEATV